MAGLKADYLKGGYFDENNKPRRELYIDWAKYIAEEFYRQGVTRASLRRFYAQVKGIEPSLKKENDFKNNKHRLYPLFPLANYAVNREENHLPVIFKDFFEKNLELALKDNRHFKAFVDHLQSIVAYFRGK
jgi:CRISPR type III-A-associated protein Csm2